MSATIFYQPSETKKGNGSQEPQPFSLFYCCLNLFLTQGQNRPCPDPHEGPIIDGNMDQGPTADSIVRRYRASIPPAGVLYLTKAGARYE